MRGLCEWSALRLRVVGGTDCVIRELCEDAQVLQQWTERLGVPYRGQRLAGASLEVFLHLLQGRREDTRAGGKSCWRPARSITSSPWPSLSRGRELQALCVECHRTKTSLEGNHSTTLESRFCRYVYQNYAATPRLPPLVFQLQKWDEDRPCQGIDVCRCRKNGLANARFPLPVFCPRACWTGCPTWGEAGTPSPFAPTCWKRGWPSGSTSSGAWTQRRMWTSAAWNWCWIAWSRTGRWARSTTPSWPSTASWACSLGIWN